MKSKKNNVNIHPGIYREMFESASIGIHLVDISTYKTIMVNNYLLEKLGYGDDELLGCDIWKIFQISDHVILQDIFHSFFNTSDPSICNVDLVCRDNSVFRVDINLSVFELDHQKYLLLCYTDVSERTKCQEDLEKLLEEKENSIREINHRVKNNLQIISSFLNIQLLNHDNQNIKNIFLDIENKIRTIALMHDHMSQKGCDNKINVKSYLAKLIGFFQKNSILNNINKLIEYRISIESISMKMKLLLPIALIINEIITNSTKHAFGNMTEGIIEVVFKKRNKGYLLMISDNGRGIPEEKLNSENKTYGTVILNSLIKQIDASVEVVVNPGTKYIIEFPE